MLSPLTLILAQYTPPWEETAAPAATRPATTGGGGIDLSHGFQQVYGGSVSENTFRNGMLVVIGIVAIVALITHLRQRRTQPKELSSQLRLGMELCRLVEFPFGSRVALWWVARSTHTPVATLLISPHLFEQAVSAWSGQPTFAPLRRWGRVRLARLHEVLFAEG